MSEIRELVEKTKDKDLIITTGNIIQAAKAYQEAASLPPEAMTSIISAVQAAYGLEQLIKKQRRLPPEKRKALVSVSPGRVITDSKLKEIDEFVAANRIPYNCLYIAKDGNIAIKASGWRLRAQADLRCFRGFEEKPIEMQVLDDGNILFRKEVVAVFWNGSRFPATGFADVKEVQSRRTMTEAPPSFVAMICLSPETRILTSDYNWKEIGQVEVGEKVMGFDMLSRKLKPTIVLGKRYSRGKRVKVIGNNARLIASPDHLLLARYKSNRYVFWRYAGEIGQYLPYFLTSPFDDFTRTEDYDWGYIKGLSLGDGCLKGSRAVQIQLVDSEPLDRMEQILRRLNIPYHRGFATSQKRQVTYHVLTFGSPSTRDWLRAFVSEGWRDSIAFKLGFIAGLFDAEGCGGGRFIRISNTNENLLAQFIKANESLGFRWSEPTSRKRRENWTELRECYLLGDVGQRLRFLAMTRPTLSRKWDSLNTPVQQAIEVEVEPYVDGDLVDIATDIGTFIAEGFLVHNCETRAKTRALRDAIGLPFEIAEDVIEAAEAEYQPSAPAPSGEITSIAELLARAQKEFGLRRRDILNILGVNSLGEITDLQASWEKISVAGRQTGAGETEEDAA